jgi:peptidoglycan/LPS O-acetylase OafA/YrhL
MALIALIAFGGTVSAVAVVCNLLLVQAWVPSQSVFFGLNTPSWSLSCEALFYLCFPILLRAVDRLRVRWLWPMTILAMASVCLMPALALALPAGQRYWFVFVLPPVRMLEFLIGILLARVVRAGLWIPLAAVPAAGLAIVGYVGSGYLPGSFSYIAGTVVPLALLIPAVATTDLRGGYSILRSRTMVWLGEISFAFYLLHQLVIRFVYKAFGSRSWPTFGALCLIVAMLALALAASWLLYRVVEQPLMDRLAGRRTAPEPAAAATEVAPAPAT